jgi:hypothetical protein
MGRNKLYNLALNLCCCLIPFVSQTELHVGVSLFLHLKDSCISPAAPTRVALLSRQWTLKDLSFALSLRLCSQVVKSY